VEGASIIEFEQKNRRYLTDLMSRFTMNMVRVLTADVTDAPNT